MTKIVIIYYNSKMDIQSNLSTEMTIQQVEELIKTKYPELKLSELDNETICEILSSLISEKTNQDTQVKLINEPIKEDSIIGQNISMAFNCIPEMFLENKHIILKGKLNNLPVNILIDTGATINLTWKNVVQKAGLEYLVDTNSKINLRGVESSKDTMGKIWYTDLYLNLDSKNEYNSLVEVTLYVADSDRTLDEKSTQIILGLGFLRAYGSNIDFKTNTLTLNGNLKIKFNLD